MSTPLDSILSGRSDAPAQEQEIKQETTEAQQAQPEKVPEGDHPQDDVRADERGMVPQQALHAERQKAKRYTEQVASFESKLSAVEQQLAARDRQISELLQRIPQQQQEPRKRPDFFENPDAAMAHSISETVDPRFQQISSVMTHNSALIAFQLHGEDVVRAADKAFTEAYERRALDPADYEKVIKSPNVFDAAVRWHKRQQALAEIGDDPAAYKERLKSELLAELQQQNGQQQQEQPLAAVMPSNLTGARNVGTRSGPAWSGPAPLNDIFDRRNARK